MQNHSPIYIYISNQKHVYVWYSPSETRINVDRPTKNYQTNLATEFYLSWYQNFPSHVSDQAAVHWLLWVQSTLKCHPPSTGSRSVGCSESMVRIHKWKNWRPQAAFAFDDDDDNNNNNDDDNDDDNNDNNNDNNNKDDDVLFVLLKY